MLEAKNLLKKYRGKTVLDDVSVSAVSGSCLGVAGHNGSGKTTLLSIIAQAIEKDGGKLLFNGSNIWGDKMFLRKNIGYVPQNDALLPDLTVKETLSFWQKTYGLDNNQLLSKDGIVKLMGLEEIFAKKVSSLSGGMKRRLSIAAALIHKPGIVILDESMSPLDREYKKTLKNFLHRFKNSGGLIIYCSHEIEELSELADNIIVLKKGKCVFYDKADNLPSNQEELDILLGAG